MRDHLENVRNLIVSKTGQDPFETQATIEEAEPDEDQDTSGMELCFCKIFRDIKFRRYLGWKRTTEVEIRTKVLYVNHVIYRAVVFFGFF